MRENSLNISEKPNGTGKPTTRLRIAPRFTIGVRLISFVVLVALLAGGAVGFTVISVSRDSLHQTILRNNLAQADLAAEFASNYMSVIQANIRAFAMRPTIIQAILDNEPERAQSELSEFVQTQASIASSAITDEKGIQRVFSQLGVTTIGQSFTDRDWFQQPAATLQPYQGIAVKSRATGLLVAPYGVPILDGQGKFRGVLSAGISLGKLSDAIVNINYGSDTSASLIDTRGGGVILADANPEHLSTPISGQDEVMRLLLAGEQGTIENTGVSGEKELTGFASVPDLPWGVMVTTPSKSALAIIDTLTITAGIFTGFAILLAAVTGGILMLGVTRPVRRLADATREIGGGNLDYKVDVSGNDEIGDLSRAFGHMAQELKQTMVSRDELAKEITERKLAEEENALKARLLDAATDSIVLRDFDGEIQTAVVYANEAVYQSRGYTREEFLKLDISDYITPESAIDYNDRFRQILKKGAGIFQVVHRRKDGSTISVEVHSNPIFINNRSYVLSVMRDITARKKAEDALKASEEKARYLLHSIPVSVSITSPNGTRAIEPNKALLEMYGFESEDEFLRTPNEARYFDGGERQRWIEIAAKGPVKDYELKLKRKDGTVFWASRSSINLGPEYGGQRIVVTTDITRIKQAEEDLKKYRDHLEELVKERTSELEIVNNELKQEITEHKKDEQTLVSQARDLEMANAELSAVNKELESFSYSVSHDLRAPLRSIDGFSQILLEEYGAKFEGESKNYLKRVRQASQRMGVLIDDVLGLSRVTRSEMRIIPIDLSALANLIVDELRSAQPYRRVEVVIEPGLTAEGDAHLLRIMLTNFLSNAWKFTGKHPRAKIEFGKTIHDGKEVFFVRDDGAGFDIAYAGKLFQPFQRLHGLNEFEGTGIGLATAQRVINRHGGKVWVEAAVEKGATFYFMI